MLECVDVTTELHHILKLFTTYLQSQSVGMQQLVLRGILQLSKRQDTVSRGGRECHRCCRLVWAYLPQRCSRTTYSSAPLQAVRRWCSLRIPSLTAILRAGTGAVLTSLCLHLNLEEGVFFPQARPMIIFLLLSLIHI